MEAAILFFCLAIFIMVINIGTRLERIEKKLDKK